MTTRSLVARNLRHFWPTNLAVAIGVGVAVSSLAGALVVGESVRASLRELALARLGQTDYIVTATTLFTEQLAERLRSQTGSRDEWSGAVPVLALEGVVSHERSGSRAGAVQVFGVDDRFWSFHAVEGVNGPAARDAFLSTALARELGAAEGDALLVRVQKPSAIPSGIIQGRRDEPGRAIRLSTARVLERRRLGDFSPRPQQGGVRAIFVPLDRLQRDLDLLHRVNMLLFGARHSGTDGTALARIVREKADLADLGVRMRPIAAADLPASARDARASARPRRSASEGGKVGPYISVESDAGLLTDALARGAIDAAREIGVEPAPVLTYLATAIRANGRETPYSLVSALPPSALTVGKEGNSNFDRPIWLSQWTANDLAAKPGDSVQLEYYLWSDQDGLTTATADFTLAGILPMTGLAVDADLTPEYPGLSTSANITDWDPPFPVDLKRIRPKDEEYWDDYLTAPKAFVRLEDGQALWRSRYGQLTSVRIPAGARTPADLHAAYRAALPRHLDPSIAEFRAVPVRADALAAASGTTDFGEYFTYFSFFLVVSSLLLTMLFFRLGVEQRAREIGVLAALGYTPRAIRGLLLAEGLVLATGGAILGLIGALGYSWLIMLALRTWWVDAVGTTDLEVHASPAALATGAVAGIVTGLGCIAWSLRSLRLSSTRQLMSGGWVDAGSPVKVGAGFSRLMIGTFTLALALVVFSSAGWIPQAAAFFGSGACLLIAGLCGITLWLRGTSRHAFALGGWPLARLGLRNARYRPSRSVLSVALIAAATFLIVSVGAFRRGAEDTSDVRSPSTRGRSLRAGASGGFALIGETMAPLMHDPSTPAGRDALGLSPELTDRDGIRVARFRLRPGDDASCLNLYRPQSPRLLGATREFVRGNRFTFSQSLAASDVERENPWLLIERPLAQDEAIPIVGDATSLAYVFHLGVGDEYVMQGPDGRPLRLRIVGALRDSVLQSELVMSDANFTRLFPRNEGFRMFLIDAEPSRVDAVAAALERGLEDFGMDVQSTAERLASYHRVENTFLTTFQALGGLGLLLGTLGLGTVLLRNVLERRRELALLRATGYRKGHLVLMVIAESVFLLACGLLLGTFSAFVAIAPAYLDRAQPFPVAGTLGLLAAVLATGLLSTIMATRAVASSQLLPALKNE